MLNHIALLMSLSPFISSFYLCFSLAVILCLHSVSLKVCVLLSVLCIRYVKKAKPRLNSVASPPILQKFGVDKIHLLTLKDQVKLWAVLLRCAFCTAAQKNISSQSQETSSYKCRCQRKRKTFSNHCVKPSQQHVNTAKWSNVFPNLMMQRWKNTNGWGGSGGKKKAARHWMPQIIM